MKKLGEVDLPLHAGKCPKPVFDSITKATQSFLEVFLSWHSPQLFLKYLGHPLWLQSFGAFLGFDWHSSGLTTVLLSALQKAGSRLKPQKVFVCGGKKRSRYTLQDIAEIGEKEGISLDLVLKLQKTSRLTAKIDSALLQDFHQIYVHFVVFTPNGEWVVIQQGMNTQKKSARRYHWSWEREDSFFSDPHKGIVTKISGLYALNWVSSFSQKAQKEIVKIVQSPYTLIELFSSQKTLFWKARLSRASIKEHPVLYEDFNIKNLQARLAKLEENTPVSFEQLVLFQGFGPKTWRALALACELLSGEKVAFLDPARYSFAHGGKDGVPYPLDLKTLETTACILEKAIKRSPLSPAKKDAILKNSERVLSQATKGSLQRG